MASTLPQRGHSFMDAICTGQRQIDPDWDHNYYFYHSIPDPRRSGNSHARVVRDP